MRAITLVLCGFLCVCVISVAQESAAPSSGPAPDAPATAAAPAPATAAPAPSAPADATTPAAPAVPAPAAAPAVSAAGGDVIVLKSGKRIVGQILKRTPRDFEVQLIQGVTLTIPRKQIETFELDEIEAKTVGAPSAGGSSAQQDMIPGAKLSPQLYEKLTADASNPPLKFEKRDVVEAAAELAKRFDIVIEVEDSVKSLPAEKRLWSCEAAAGTTLLMLLNDNLHASLPDVKAVFQFDKVVLTADTTPTPPAAPEAPKSSTP